jgi:hypothetical protein
VTHHPYFQALNDAAGGSPAGLQLQPSGHFTRLNRQKQQAQKQQCMIIVNFEDVCIVWTPQGYLPALKQVASDLTSLNVSLALTHPFFLQQSIVIAEQLRASCRMPLPPLVYPPFTAHQSALPWFPPFPSTFEH